MMRALPRVVIYGPGNLGCYFGGWLLLSGVDVAFIDRPSFARTARSGFDVKDPEGRHGHVPPGSIETISPESITSEDVVVVAVKSGATADVAAKLSQAAPRSIVSIQNGLRNSEILAEACPSSEISPAIVPFNVVRDKDDTFTQTARGHLVVQNGATRLVSALSHSGIPYTTVPDIGPVRRGKLLMNLNNAIHALSGQSLPAELRDRGFRRILANAQEEALLAFRTNGLAVSSPIPGLPARAIPTLLRLPSWIFVRVAKQMLKDDNASSSMRDDLEAGRPTEVDWLNGEICRILESSQREALVNARLVEIVKQSENAARLPCYTATELTDLVNYPGRRTGA